MSSSRITKPREYCGAQDPNRKNWNECCVLGKGHVERVPHRDMAGNQWTDAESGKKG